MNPLNESKEHLAAENESYLSHAGFALKWGLYLIFAGFISILHAFLPFVFPFTVPKMLKKVDAAAKARGHRQPAVEDSVTDHSQDQQSISTDQKTEG